jgi:hypothetical protein
MAQRGRLGGLALVGLLLLATGMAVTSGATVAIASPNVQQTCLNNINYPCYARGTFYNGYAYGGAFVYVDVQSMSASGNPYLNETLWACTNSSACSYWAEIGYTRHSPLCRGQFRWYYTYVNPSAGVVQTCFGSTPSVGTSYSLEAQEVYSDQYDIYLNGSLVTTDVGTTGWTYYAYTGLEWHLLPSSLGGNAYFSAQQVRSTGCCSWYYWPAGGTNVSYPQYYNWGWTSTNPWDNGFDN